MNKKVVDLYSTYGLERKDGATGYLTCYTLDDYNFCEGRVRPAMLVLAGGGYAHLSQREKEPIAFSYMSKGFNVFILDYSLEPLSYPTQLIEGCMAVAHIRENAEEYHVDKEHICAIGFSAGGHLCGMLATLYDEKEVKDALGVHAESCRLDGVILSYAVLSAYGQVHAGSIMRISGGNEEIRKKLDLPARVTENSVPAFIWHTVDDGSVPSESSLLMAMAYKQKNVPFELHIFESGCHGLSLASKETASSSSPTQINVPVQKWIDLTYVWLEKRGFVIKNKGE